MFRCEECLNTYPDSHARHNAFGGNDVCLDCAVVLRTEYVEGESMALLKRSINLASIANAAGLKPSSPFLKGGNR